MKTAKKTAARLAATSFIMIPALVCLANRYWAAALVVLALHVAATAAIAAIEVAWSIPEVD